MNVPLYLLTLAHLICAAAGAVHVSLERQLQEEGIRSGRRTCRLYCRVGIGFHLQIHPDGRVNGSHEPSQLSVLELFAVSQGVIGIKGVYSNRFLAMNKRGRLHATEWFTDDCKFRERFQENSYNTYASLIHRNHRTGREWFVALNKRGKAKMGSSPRVKSQHVSTHFLPRVNLHDKDERGFTITARSKERRKNPLQPPPPPPLKSPPVKPNVHAGAAPRRTQVKYWPKYRFVIINKKTRTASLETPLRLLDSCEGSRRKLSIKTIILATGCPPEKSRVTTSRHSTQEEHTTAVSTGIKMR